MGGSVRLVVGCCLSACAVVLWLVACLMARLVVGVLGGARYCALFFRLVLATRMYASVLLSVVCLVGRCYALAFVVCWA